MSTSRKREKPPLDLSSVMYGKVPPQASELEEAILGVLLLEPDAIHTVVDFLKAEYFYKEANQRIFRAIYSVYKSGNKIDIYLVIDQLKRTEDLDVVGGPYYLTKLTNGIVSGANIDGWIRIVVEKYIQREIIRNGGEAIGNAYEDSSDCFDNLNNLTQSINHLHYEIEQRKTVDLTTMAFNYQKSRDVPPDAKFTYTNMPGWDRINGWLFNGGLYFVAARPGMGKTNFVIETISRTAPDTPVGFINLEMTNDQIVKRYVSNNQRIHNDELKRDPRECSEELNKKIYAGMQEFVNLKLYVESKSGLTVDSIIAKLRYWKHKHGIKLAIIDYLQIIGISAERQKYNTELENINYNLTALYEGAKDLDIPLIILSQLNRENMKRGGTKIPEISDMKGSGKIEEVAYQIAFIHRPEYYEIMEDETGETTKNLAYLIIKKHRDGQLGKIKFKFRGEFSAFDDWDEPMFKPPTSFDDPPF